MSPDELRSLQTPLKQLYREQPDAARVTLKARVRLRDGIRAEVEGRTAPVIAGLHPKTGGAGLDACSGDLLLEALAACAGVTLGAVSTALGIVLRTADVYAEGELDFRGTLGVSKEVRVGFEAIRLRFLLDTDATAEQLANLERLTERYCVVFQTLRVAPSFQVETRAAS